MLLACATPACRSARETTYVTNGPAVDDPEQWKRDRQAVVAANLTGQLITLLLTGHGATVEALEPPGGR